jgi:hypothetical protein
VFTRTGQITTNENPPFDQPAAATTTTATTSSATAYNPNRPFQGAQQGVSGP